MNRMVNERKQPKVKPVERIELSKRHLGLRAAAAVIFALIAAAALTFSFSSLISRDSGWTTIEADMIKEKNNCAEFLFQYELGRGKVSATAEYKKLSLRFAELNAEAFRIFSADETFDGCFNLCYINRHPNEKTKIDTALFKAMKLLNDYNRAEHLFLAPVYERYKALCSCSGDSQAWETDPATNPEARKYINTLLSYIKDRSMISLELSDPDTVCLRVSPAYLEFAARENIVSYLDLHWLKNAFIADYIADALIAEGFTHGIISSFDGFVRHLGDISQPVYRDISYREGTVLYTAAQLRHENGTNVVQFRNYSKSPFDIFRYYEWHDSEKATPYIDIRDGLSKGPVSDFYIFSKKAGCAEIALAAGGVYISDRIDMPLLSESIKNGYDFVFCSDAVLRYTDKNSEFDALYENGSFRISPRRIS